MDQVFIDLDEIFNDMNSSLETLNSGLDLALFKFKQCLEEITMDHKEYIYTLQTLNKYILKRNEKAISMPTKVQKGLFGVLLQVCPHSNKHAKNITCVYQECNNCKTIFRCSNKVNKDIHAPYKCKKCNCIFFDYYTPKSFEEFNGFITCNNHKKRWCLSCFS